MYLLFAGYNNDQCGGADDLVGRFDDLNDAKEFGDKNWSKHCMWYHIFWLKHDEVVYRSSEKPRKDSSK